MQQSKRNPFSSLKIFTLYLPLAALFFSNSAIADTCKAYDPTGEYKLVFEDNFDGNELDRNKWDAEFLWGPGVVINNERQYYVNEDQFGYNPFKMDNGVLSIEAIKSPFDRTLLYLTSSIYSATSAELLWRVPANAASYDVYRDGVFQASVSGGSYFEPQIREGIDYAYEVVALDSFGNTIVTAQLTINTANRYIPSPSTPFALDLEFKVYSRGKAELFWRTPNRAGSYTVTRNGELYKTLIGPAYSGIYEADLDPDTRYTYVVDSYDRCNELILSEEITFIPDQSQNVQSSAVERLIIAVAEYSDSTAEISWNAVNGAVSYDIYEDDLFVENIDGRSVFMNDLIPGVDRRFRVVVLDGDGNTIDETGRVINTADNSYALNRQAYVSGVITSYTAFRFLYGRVEMRARMPAGKGLWSAFWLLNAYYNQDQPADPEIDIIEAIGDKTTTAHQAYHYKSDNNGDGTYESFNSSEDQSFINDFSADFHIYSVDWSEGLLIWYVDGVEVKRVEGDAVSDEQMYIIANLAVGGTFPGPADESTPFPAKFEIDYIRAYQR